MKKIFLFIILFLFPFMVFAKDMCDSNDIKIQSIVLENSTGNMEELSNPSVNNQRINLGLKMNVLGDAAEYKIVLKNNSNEDYYFDEKVLNIDMESVNYEVSFDDNTNFIKGGEEKVVYLKVSYKEQVDSSNLNNGIYDGTQVMKLNIMTLENPFTGRFLGVFIFISLVVGFFVLYRDKKKSAYLLLVISFIIPFTVNAVCKHSLEIENSIVIDARNAIFLPGSDINVKIKQLSGNDLSSVTNPYSYLDEIITSIQYFESEPLDNYKNEANTMSIPESQYPIYMWFDNGILYWWSEDKTPALNEDASYMFSGFSHLNDISGLQRFDVSQAVKINNFLAYGNFENLEPLSKWNFQITKQLMLFFAYNKAITNVDALSDWDISNVESIAAMFSTCINLSSIEGIKNWDVSKVVNLNQLFLGVNSLSSLSALRNWDTSSVKYISGLFARNTSLTSTDGLENWDVSQIESMNGVFSQDTNLSDIEALRNWNTKSAKLMFGLLYNTKIVSTDPIKNWNTSSATSIYSLLYNCPDLVEADLSGWDTSNVTDMSGLFEGSSNLRTINISNWDTSNVTNMSYMFSNLGSLTELDLSSFNTKKVTAFKRMFNGSNNLEKIYVGENWDTSANTNETKYVFPTTSNLPNFSNANPNYRDLRYAHTGEGGYLTLKTN